MNPECMQLGVVQGTGKVGLAFKPAPDLQGEQGLVCMHILCSTPALGAFRCANEGCQRSTGVVAAWSSLSHDINACSGSHRCRQACQVDDPQKTKKQEGTAETAVTAQSLIRQYPAWQEEVCIACRWPKADNNLLLGLRPTI